MTASFTSTKFVAIALTVICATGSVLAQQARPTSSPAKKPVSSVATRTTTTRPSAVASQRTAVSPTTAPKPNTTQVATTPAPAKPAEAPVAAPEKPHPGVQTASARTTQARPTTTQPAKTMGLSRQKYLNAGVGLAAYYGGGLPLGVSLEVDWKNNISVGGSIDYFRYGYNSGGYKWNYTFVYAGVRGSYHLGEVLNAGDSKFDPYVGATLGFRYAGYQNNYGYDYSSPYNSGIFLGVHLGSRYMFSPKIGAFAEVGYGVSALRLGVTAKL